MISASRDDGIEKIRMKDMERRIVAFRWYWADGVFKHFLSPYISRTNKGSHQGAFLYSFETKQGDDCTIWEFLFFGVTWGQELSFDHSFPSSTFSVCFEWVIRTITRDRSFQGA